MSFSLFPADVKDLKSLQRDFDALSDGDREKIAASPTWKELLAMLQHVKASKGKRAAEIVGDNIPGEDDPSLPDDGFPENLGGKPKSEKAA